MNACIYLDHHATTPLDDRVYRKMSPFFLHQFGNPASSSHSYGWQAQTAVNEAREKVACAIGAHPGEVIFTSGATEATNMALKGLFWPPNKMTKRHVVSSAIEHPATLSTLSSLEAMGVRATYLSPQKCGTISTMEVASALGADTALVSLFFVHNEIGTINPVAEMAQVAHNAGVLVHIDATQALGRVPIDCEKLQADMMSFSGHKIYGPKGVGFLYVRKSCQDKISPLIHGGGQELRLRSGTLNVPGIVGMAEACALATQNLAAENHKISQLRDRLLGHFHSLAGVHQNGDLAHKVSANLNLSFEGIDGEALVLSICHKVAISTGSACSSSGFGPNKVLAQLGVTPELAQATLRFGLGRFNVEQEIDEAAGVIIAEIKQQRMKTIKKKLVKLGDK